MAQGDYRTPAQKAGKSAGQRKRQGVRQRKKRNREANVYPITVRASIIEDTGYDNEKLAVYGVYERDDEWHLTAMALQRDIEKTVPNRQGATKNKVRDKTIVSAAHGAPLPEHGLELGTFHTKKAALQYVNADTSTRVGTGNYIVKLSDWSRKVDTHKVDRTKFGEFLRSNSTSPVR